MASSSSGSNLSSQRKMRNVSEDIDYISRLPEPVMLYILSFLPTKDLMVVSLLSKLWKNNVVNHLSSVSSSLKFDELEMVRSFITRSIQRDRANFHSAYSTQQYLMQLIGAAKMHYVDFVHQALMLHTGCTIKNLHLSFCHQGNERYRARVASWVRFCLTNKIEVLYLDFSRGEPLRAARSDRPYELPDATFSTRVLQNLTLAYCKIRPIHFGVLISLQKLCLKQVKFFYCSLGEIASKCPVLEEVTLDHCVFPNEFMVSEQDVKIKKLIMIDCKTNQLPMFTIDMSFPDMLSLVFIGRYLMMSSIRNASQLVDTMIDVQQIYADHVQGDALASMLNGLDHCKTLTLNAWCIQVLPTGEELLERLHTPLTGVEQLKLILGLGKQELPGIACLIRSCPNLKILTLMIQDSITVNWAEFEEDIPNILDFQEETYWYFQRLPFNCLQSTLERVKIYGFKGMINEMQIVRFLLDNALVLEKMDIYYNAINMEAADATEEQLNAMWYQDNYHPLRTAPRLSNRAQVAVFRGFIGGFVI